LAETGLQPHRLRGGGAAGLSRRACLAALLGLGVDAGAFASDAAAARGLAPLWWAIDPLIRAAKTAHGQGRYMEACRQFEAVLSRIDDAGPGARDMRVTVLPYHALSLLALGQNRPAAAALQEALELEQWLASGSGDPRLQKVVSNFARGLSREIARVEFGREALGRMVVKDQPSVREMAQLLFDEGMGSCQTVVALARAWARLGEPDALLQLYEQDRQRQPDEACLTDPTAPIPAAEYRLFGLAAALAACGQRDRARDALRRCLQLNWARCRFVGTLSGSREMQLGAFSVRRHELGAAIGIALGGRLADDEGGFLIARILESKALGVRYAQRLLQLLRQGDDDPSIRSAREQLERIEATAPEEAGAADLFWRQLRQLASSAGALSPAMPALVRAGLGEVFVSGEAVRRSATEQLPTGVFIGFVSYAALSPDGRGFGERRYARYLMQGEASQLIDVGPCREIDGLVTRWRRSVRMSATEQEAQALARSLAERLLKGLPEAAWDGATRWVIEPDGALGLLPFEVLPDREGSLLGWGRCITYATSLAAWCDATQPQPQRPAPPPGPCVIVADPAYPANPVGSALSNSGEAGRRAYPAPLPETRQEAEAVAASLRRQGLAVKTFMGADAVPAALKFDRTPRVLHIAAHALIASAPWMGGEGAADVDAQVEMLQPGRRCALLLAGSSRASLLRADELQQLQLSGAELVVLSACDSGNGFVESGEGVASLRRALEVAGARGSLTSLWPVNSVATVRLMSDFYDGLASGLSAPAALWQAKRHAISRGLPVAHWSAFLLAGRWADPAPRS